jgi:hypothetical protein
MVFFAENHHTYGHICCVYTALANPLQHTAGSPVVKCEQAAALPAPVRGQGCLVWCSVNVFVHTALPPPNAHRVVPRAWVPVFAITLSTRVQAKVLCITTSVQLPSSSSPKSLNYLCVQQCWVHVCKQRYRAWQQAYSFQGRNSEQLGTTPAPNDIKTAHPWLGSTCARCTSHEVTEQHILK